MRDSSQLCGLNLLVWLGPNYSPLTPQPPRLEDHEALLKFQDPASRNLAFNQLVRKCQRKVYWHVRKMVEDHHAANGCAPKP